MPIVVSLAAFMPPPRYDGVPWSVARVEEAQTSLGPWSQIDQQPLVPLDADPSQPRVRDVTTTQGTMDPGWYRLVFADVAGNVSEPSDPLRNSTDDSALPPAPSAVRAKSRLLRQKFPIPPSDPFQPSDLRTITYQATALVESLTFRILDPTTPTTVPDGYAAAAVPAGLEPVAFEAVMRMAERIYVTTEPVFAEQLATGRRLRGFSAGPYSEQYFAPGEFARRGASQGRPPMDVDDSLDSALWALATEDARDYFVWRATGVSPPTGQAVAFDYRRESAGYGAGSLGGARRGGPDGW